MSNKTLAFFDGLDTVEKLGYNTFKTSIDVRNAETGEVIFKGLKNKVIIPGSGLVARKLFDIANVDGSNFEEVTPSYNDVITTMHTPTTDVAANVEKSGTVATVNDHRVLLFCCGIDGCGTTNSEVYPVDYKKWISPENLVPFRYQLGSNDLSDELRDTYFGRTMINGGEYIAYYFKKFQSEITFTQKYIDGTNITKDTDIYNSVKTEAAESYVEINLKITKQDIRDFFKATTGQDDARINSISLCSAYPVEEGGYIYYKGIRPLTKLNFPNESFIDVSKGIDIIYHIYM